VSDPRVVDRATRRRQPTYDDGQRSRPTVIGMPVRPPRHVVRVLAAGLLVLATIGLAAAAPTETRANHRTSWTIAPGVTYRQWHFTSAQGVGQRVHVVEVNPARPGVSLAYRANAVLQRRAPTSRIVAADRTAVAGTNASYFDITDTGAPAGIGRSRTRGLLHAPASGWNNAFYQATDGSYHVGTLGFRGRIAQYPTWPVTGLNLPHARPDAITIYTPVWGDASGRAIVDHRRTPVREVHVRDGVVRQNSTTLRAGHRFEGYLLVGLGRGARLLRSLKPGTGAGISWALDPTPLMAVSGSQVLVRSGRVVATSDHQTAPRTSVGIDTDTGHVLLVALDGRAKNARGMTMAAWGRFLASLGIDDAINLDGGGSSTMVARGAGGGPLGVVNRPSLGHERAVPDALTVDVGAAR
jgi:hypothetical protein